MSLSERVDRATVIKLGLTSLAAIGFKTVEFDTAHAATLTYSNAEKPHQHSVTTRLQTKMSRAEFVKGIFGVKSPNTRQTEPSEPIPSDENQNPQIALGGPSANEGDKSLNQLATAVIVPPVFDALKINSYGEIPDFGEGPYTYLKEYDFSEKWGHSGNYKGSEFIITKTARENLFGASRRLEGFYTDFKAEVSFRFLTTPTNSTQFAGFHFGFRPDENALQGFFMVRPLGGPREGDGQGQGDIFLMYQENKDGKWGGYNKLFYTQFVKMGVPFDGHNRTHNLQLVARGGELLPFYNGNLVRDRWTNHPNSPIENRYPVKDPVGPGELGVVAFGNPSDHLQVAFSNFRVVGTIVK